MREPNYYSSISSRMMREFNAMYRCTRVALGEHYTESEIDELEAKSRSAYIDLFARLPYIGGRKNSETINVIMGAIVVAIVRPLVRTDLQERHIGKIIYRTFEGYFESRSKWTRMILGRLATTNFSVKRIRKQIEDETYAEYENSFRLANVDSAAADFDFGYNYTHCTLCRIFADNGISEYLKYVCLGDYPLFKSIGVGFTRTQTIAHGAPVCDFRFTRHGAVPEAWPPEDLPEWCDR